MQLNNLLNPHLYFAYGSNLDPEQMDWRCPDAIALGAARLDDWAWRIGGRGYATVSPSPGHHVWGGAWNVSDSDLARLDRYEGVAGGHYRREFVIVMAEDQPVELHLLYRELRRPRITPPRLPRAHHRRGPVVRPSAGLD